MTLTGLEVIAVVFSCITLGAIFGFFVGLRVGLLYPKGRQKKGSGKESSE